MVSPQAMVRTSKGLLSSDVLMHGEPDTPPHVEVTEWLYLKKKIFLNFLNSSAMKYNMLNWQGV